MTDPAHLHTEIYGPTTGSTVLAIHGLTGHGRRWQPLASQHLSDVRIVAPDLLGHGHSSWDAPWTFDAHLDALDAAIEAHIAPRERPFILVGHSFGAALSIRLAQRRPDDVAALILLDPAQGLDPVWAAQIAGESMAHWTYADADAARAAKRSEGWADVPDAILDAEIETHLIPLGDAVGWRVSQPAAATAWSEMAQPAALPPPDVPTTIVVADRVDPPFVTDEFLRAATELTTVSVEHVDCEHMVPFLAPDLVANLVRKHL